MWELFLFRRRTTLSVGAQAGDEAILVWGLHGAAPPVVSHFQLGKLTILLPAPGGNPF